MRHVRTVALAVALALAAGSAVLAQGNQASTPASPVPASSWRVPKGDPVRGAKLAEPCLGCHGKEAAGGGVHAPRLRHQRESYLFFALLDYRDGRRTNELMAGFAAGLTDQDARDLSAYLAGEFVGPPPKAHTDMPIYRKTIRECTWCHGETGLGEYEGMPMLTGQDPAFLANALAEYRSGVRKNPTMEAIVARHPPSDDSAFAAYYAQYSWLEYE